MSYTMREIEWAVCAKFNLTREQLKSPDKRRCVARPRQIAMYLSRTLTKNSLPQIGRYFGGRDHTTVIHAMRVIPVLMEEKPKLAAHIEEVRANIPTENPMAEFGRRLAAGEIIISG